MLGPLGRKSRGIAFDFPQRHIPELPLYSTRVESILECESAGLEGS